MFILPWIMLVPFAIADQIVMTLIVHYEYTNYRVDWQSDGRPMGFSGFPEKPSFGDGSSYPVARMRSAG